MTFAPPVEAINCMYGKKQPAQDIWCWYDAAIGDGDAAD